MTESQLFLRNNLNKIFLKLDNVEISYEFRGLSNTHIIEVKPNSIYSNCIEYIDMEIELEEEFMMKFPEEEILFISEESLTSIEMPLFVLKYKVQYSFANLYTPIKVKNDLSIDCFDESDYTLAA